MNDQRNDPGSGSEPDEGQPEGAQARGEPAELLGELAALRRQARSARHAYWFPLVLFGLLSCAALPFYRSVFATAGSASGYRSIGVAQVALVPPASGMPLLGQSPSQSSFFLGYYWLVALVGGYLLTALWYRRHARLAGLQTPARGYVVTGIALTAAALLLPPLSQFRALAWLGVLFPGDLVVRGTFPFLIIAAALWVLAWAERSRGLAVTALLYSGAALLASLYDVENVLFQLGWNPSFSETWWATVPNLLLPSLVLLIAGAAAGAAAAAKRRQQQRTA